VLSPEYPQVMSLEALEEKACEGFRFIDMSLEAGFAEMAPGECSSEQLDQMLLCQESAVHWLLASNTLPPTLSI
jgi:hypothetical protein